MEDKELVFTYKNYKGEISKRHIIPGSVWFGKTNYHPTLQWLLSGYDCDKRAYRDFSMKDIISFDNGGIPNE